MPVDRSALDEAVRRFPFLLRDIRRAAERGYEWMLSARLIEAIRREYRLIVAERAKQRRKAA